MPPRLRCTETNNFFLLLKRKWIETESDAEAEGIQFIFLSLIKEEVD
ncbi:hypothetical protein LEP1GSC081_4456 [Leptospira kirschneri str. H1]|uniref:Uncharacterized protein n=1 Tax=Leptospira kirschneri str. H1 TaxID=1049966 RepID=A0A0E2BD43_9LEPT|nr:hypothetical protein LEP1GSC081_4456 [Leptospira kirschneri str. H1]